MSFRSLADLRENNEYIAKPHRKVGKRRSNSAPTIGSEKAKDVNAVDNKGRTSLYYAAKYGELEMVRHLLKNGGDPNIPDKSLNFPIHEAVDNGHIEVIELLSRKGCNLNCKNMFGQTSLMRATLFGDLETVKLLIKYGANTDDTECTGKTALLLGIREGASSVCKYLIKSGSDVNVVDKLGQSALFLSTRRTPVMSDVIHQLYQHGYTSTKDSKWLPGNLKRKLEQNGLFSRLMRKLGIKRKSEFRLRRRHDFGRFLRFRDVKRTVETIFN